MTMVIILCALLATGLALALSREIRIRRAFQALAGRVLQKFHEHSGTGFMPHARHRPTHYRSRS